MKPPRKQDFNRSALFFAMDDFYAKMRKDMDVDNFFLDRDTEDTGLEI